MNLLKKLRKTGKIQKRFTNWKLIAAGGGVLALLLGGMSYYQATHFNSNVTINDTKVGGLSADQAIQKLKTSGLANKVYIDQQQILDEKETKTELTEKDLPQVKKLLKASGHFSLLQRKRVFIVIERSGSVS